MLKIIKGMQMKRDTFTRRAQIKETEHKLQRGCRATGTLINLWWECK